MWPTNLTFLQTLCLTINFSHYGYAANPEAISSYRDLLANLSACDLQIFHSRDYDNQLNSIDLISTTIFMPMYEHLPLFHLGPKHLPVLDVFKSRVSPCRLSFIFLSPNSFNSKDSFQYHASGWIRIASICHLYYRMTYYSLIVPSTNAFISVVVNKSAMKIKLTEGNYPYAVEKLRSNREEWCVDETQISPNTINNKPLGRTKLSVNQLAFQIYSYANVTLAKFIACSTPRDKHVQLKFNLANRPQDSSLILIETDFEGYHFLTCYSEPYISLYFYVSPYQAEVWVVLGTTISTIIAITIALKHFSSLLEQQPFSIWMYILASLFEEGASFPVALRDRPFSESR
ncbi:hypothetical protein Fcan01_24427 [Folsomia candida]|uniref:Uncharacterized protein n=1 Tax=Folsomia candida TaxID=158441 RepID=A0A226D6J4_FOLCA|nr:hypothetical protein Fcan01_24427 [Folsomia candida]